MLESTAIYSVEATGQVYNQTNEVVYLGGNINHNADLSIEVNRRIRNTWYSFWTHSQRLASPYRRPSRLRSCVYARRGGYRHIQRRGRRPDVQPNGRGRLSRGERPPQCRPVHQGRPASTQRMVQLSGVHSRTARPIERPPRARNPDAKSRGTRD